MPKHTVPVLPFDVIGNIIDILVNDVPKSLPDVKAFSLTCQSFLPLCRNHIFSSIHIYVGFPSQLRNGEAFGQFLLETPSIARYVRRLIIWIEHPPLESKTGFFFDKVPQQLTWLQSLTIWRPIRKGHGYSLPWKNISSSMRCSLLSLMRLPTLTYLDLRGIGYFFTSDLITCSNLQYFYTNGLLIADKNDSALSSRLHKPIQLHEFDTTLTLEVLSLLELKCSDGRPVLDFALLKKISITFDWMDYGVDQTQEILSGTQQLTDIRLIIFDTSFRGMQFAKTIMPALQTLRRLHLAIYGWEVTADPLEDFCDELEKLSGKNRLEFLEIELDLESDDWSRLDRIFLTTGWPMLKQVSFVLIVSVEEENSTSKLALETLPQRQFTNLTSSKNLEFLFSVRNK